MVSRSKIESVLREIFGDEITDETEERIAIINRGFDERDESLRGYGDFEGDGDEVEFRGREILEPSDVNWQAKYNSLHQRYLDKFFGGNVASEGDDTVELDTTEEVDPELKIEDVLMKEEED